MRTTTDTDDPLLRDLKRLQQREGKNPFGWISRPMKALVDLADKHARLGAMDEPRP